MRSHRTDSGILSALHAGSGGGCDSPHFLTRSGQSRGSNVIPTLGRLGRESVMEPHSLLHRDSEIPRAGFGRSRAQTMKRTRANVTQGKMCGLFARKSQRSPRNELLLSEEVVWRGATVSGHARAATGRESSLAIGRAALFRRPTE